MIPDGWVLVPVIPSERMLTEFSGVWAPWLPTKRRELELQAYAAMLAVVPSAPAPGGGVTEVQLLREQVRKLEKRLGQSQAETRKAYKKLAYAWDKIRALRNDDDEKPNPIH